MKQSKKTKGLLLGVAGIILLLAGGGAYYLYHLWTKAPAFNVGAAEAVWLYVYPEATWEETWHKLDSLAPSDTPHTLQRILEWKVQGETPRMGAYLIAPDETAQSVTNKLLRGRETPVRLTFTSRRLPAQMYSTISKQLLMDSLALAEAMNDTLLLQQLEVPDTTLVYYLIPNTYEVYWTITPEELVRRMTREARSFWDEERRSKAEALGLSIYEVIILASIVAEESNKVDEYPDIAGLYLNRLRMGMRLQADPTVKYALQDFGLQRILHKHLRVESPYNTYYVEGLPQGPIRIPSIQAIEGVLNARQHHYIYMCAKADFSGYHAFASTYAEHMRNARAYSRALNDRGIQ